MHRLGFRGLLCFTLAIAGCRTRAENIDPQFGSDASLDARIDAGEIGIACDNDNICNDGVFCNGEERCVAGMCVRETRVCDDQIACTRDTCSEEQSRCVFAALDNDGDGYGARTCLDNTGMPLGIDCDDSDADRYPGNLEVCDLAGHDEDCDPQTLGTTDVDGDGQIDLRCCNTQEDGTQVCGTDCDDGRASVRPGGTEVCNGIDDDCDGMRDEDLNAVTLYRDEDGDGQGVDNISMTACGAVAGYVLSGGDCDDGDVAVNDVQPEICDTKDNNCNGLIDQNDNPPAQAVTWYLDGDGDGFGAAGDGRTAESCADPSTPTRRFSLLSTDCNDGDPNIHPTAAERCNAIDDNCNGRADFVLPGTSNGEDDDGDGRADTICTTDNGIAGTDCDDRDATTAPDFSERCDGRDNNCNGTVDENAQNQVWYRDIDGDGFGSATSGTQVTCEGPRGYSVYGGDCNDNLPSAYPGASETCNSADDNCNGSVDEGLTFVTYTFDGDGDGYGSNAGATQSACSTPTMYAPRAGDCDDSSAAISPGATETCDARDNNCNGAVDDQVDASMCSGANATMVCNLGACEVRRCNSGYVDCNGMPDDGCELQVTTETCNGMDDNCNGSVDEGLPQRSYFRDSDNDGYGLASDSTIGCGAPQPTGWATVAGDCDDSRMSRHPNAMELCNSVDDDCDGVVDDNVAPGTTVWYQDADNDSYGGSTVAFGCAAPAGTWVLRGGDCNDGVAAINPGVSAESCDATDNDCDARVDEGAEVTCTMVSGVAAPACISGSCSYTSCLTSTRDCDGNRANGCEVPTNSNTSNCGGCGIVCQTATGNALTNNCVVGQCNPSVCQPRWGNCDANGANGCETQLTSSVNCGSCGNICPSGNGAGYCSGGACAIACNMNRADCDNDVSTGCEVNTASDPNNCAGCGRVCPRVTDTSAHVSTDATCGLQPWGFVDCNLQCQPNYANCDMNSINGCEASLQNDWQNCGFCRRTCPTSAPHTTSPSTCTAGQCNVVCEAGWFNCDGQADNGCESPSMCGTGGGNYLSNVQEITMGEGHTCAITQPAGEIFCWGRNHERQLGTGDVSGQTRPTSAFIDMFTPVTGAMAIGAGRNHTCAILDAAQRRLHCWGENNFGQAGGNTTNYAAQVGSISGVQHLAVGQNNVCYATATGVWCFGDSIAGQSGENGGTVAAPGTPINNVQGAILGLVAGSSYACALTDVSGQKRIYCWGNLNGNNYGASAQEITFMGSPPATWLSASAGFNHICARGDSNNYCFGNGANARIDIGGTSNNPTPRFPAFQRVIASRDFTCGVDTGSTVRCVGWNDFGQANGSGNALPVTVEPMPVTIDDDTNPTNGTQVQADVSRFPRIAPFAQHMCVIAPNQQVWCWGRGSEGQLGRDNNVAMGIPMRVLSDMP